MDQKDPPELQACWENQAALGFPEHVVIRGYQVSLGWMEMKVLLEKWALQDFQVKKDSQVICMVQNQVPQVNQASLENQD